jgi:hypothetical protein
LLPLGSCDDFNMDQPLYDLGRMGVNLGLYKKKNDV